MKYLFASFVFALSAHATTYYIDYAGGSDSNPGTSTSAAWKRHPFMVGWSGSYSHSGGDQYIFKGGVTWPRSCFQLHITAGGSSDTARDYYGVSSSWYSGGSWSRPVFDFENTLIGSGWNNSAGVFVDGVNYLTFDGLELKRHRASIAPRGSDWGGSTINLFRSAAYITIQNCFIHDWSIPTPNSGDDGGGGGGICQVYGGGTRVLVTGCTLNQSSTSVKSGCALHLGGEVSFCEIYDTPNAFLGSGNIHDNHIHDLPSATDPLAHENAIYTQSPSSIYNNVVHNLDHGCSAIYVSPSFLGGTGYDAVYNNTVYSIGNQTSVQVDLEGPTSAQTGSRIYNNILEHANDICIRVVARGTAVLGLLDVQNNQLITANPIPVCYNFPAAGCANVITAIVKNNTVSLTLPTVLVPPPTVPPPTDSAPTPPPPTDSTQTPPPPTDSGSGSTGGTTSTPAPTDTPLINGSFENGYTGWTESGNQEVGTGGLSVATDGSYYAKFNFGQLPANAVLSQTFSTTPGRQYTVTFDLGAFSFVNRNEQRMLLVAQGASTLLSQNWSVYAPGNGTAWTHESTSFVADSSTTTLTFSDVSPTTENIDMRLDNVQILGAATPPSNPTPSPVVDTPVVNGSFENGYTGWTATGNQGIQSGGSSNASDGSYYVNFNYGQLPGNGVFTQSFPTTPGRLYNLTFDIGAFSFVNHDEQRVLVVVQGGSVLINQTSSVFAPGNGTAWASQTMTFVANSSTTSLTFQDVSPTTNNVDLRLDNVKVIGQ